MGQLLLTTDSASEIVLQESRSVAIALTVAAATATLGLRLAAPRWLIAQGMLALFAGWMLTRTLQRHRLRFDLERRTVSYHRGWWFAAALRHVSLDAVTGVYIDRYEPTIEAAGSRLRSRLISVELRDWEDGFVLGFPMGPKVAAEKAADYAQRLGVATVDRTGETESLDESEDESEDESRDDREQ